ncbi:hypothetical protein Clacol_007634 [Clathrus columnatus]|uniref:C3H1-type domain-containing protein n=1 Tax=Clathrus columnatus TaxID=1419009 RepID=A0AAV5AFG1_9AGAM|nr:hypothetical protein Clacol_007634 [Clathrus columnatus]
MSSENDTTPYSFMISLPSISVDKSISEQISHLLRPLRDEVVSKLDPMRPLCHFEVPGGGKCQDSTCHYIHLRDFEPTDDQIAQYLSRVLPEPQPSFQMIRTGLSRVRASKQEIDFDNRIIQALDHLGIR